ncbi:hypothetical protein [Undibacterium flavidum]|uniref:4Fe-4S ferredoxin-type domain-containing protein n=1 Tax=Undibacterium flavidum TaxID=2762297 RepID=A0ABR6Y7U5_9BURK|nr:hypothetical protein [Undibacterium flavidum]MBC3872695.1 hypothetical protein [Undibacterium flavidum]
MNPYQSISSPILNQAGLNCHAVFELAQLAPELRQNLREQCPQADNFKQLILIGHGGTTMWQAIQENNRERHIDTVMDRNSDEHPIDAFSIATVQRFLQTEWAGCDYEILYPGSRTIGLQSLGKQAGWHHHSPFMVGINAHFGSWFAYRVAVLANTQLPLTGKVETVSPCNSCGDKVCIAACPAQALDDGQFNLDKCLDYRQQSASLCEKTCLARVACPVGDAHRYTDAQMNYHYGRSINMIRIWQQKKMQKA